MSDALYIGLSPIVVILGCGTYYLGEHIYQSDKDREGTEFTKGTGNPAAAAILGLWNFLFPATIAYSLLYTFFLVKARIHRNSKFALLILLLVLDMIVLITSTRTPIFQLCSILGCTFASPSLKGKTYGGTDEYADDYNMPASYTNSNALTYFFTGLLALPVVCYQIFKVYRNEFARVSVNTGIDVNADPIPPLQLMKAPLASGSSRSDASSATTTQRHLVSQKNTLRWLGVFLGLVVLIPVHVICTSRLGNNFQWFFPYEVATWAAREIVEETNVGWVAQYRVSPDLVLKLFPDVMMFYGYIYLNSAVALACVFFPGTAVVRTFRSYDVTSKLNNGELLFWFGFISYLVSSFLYWYLVHGWEGNPISAVTTSERFSRTIAQTALSMLGLMILPVSRNSLWSHVFGISWEAMVRFHKVVARGFLFTVLIHMLSFWVAFSEKGVFPQAIFGSPNGWVEDNETISVMSFLVIFLVLPGMGVLTLNFFRRKHFELFKFTHFVSAVLFCAVIWHAASAWYFLLPGLTLWAVDHALRFTKACRSVDVITLRAVKGGTELRFRVGDKLQCEAMRHEAGQYCFVNVPELALLEFHPFTISSSPLDDTSSCHIKAMGASTWTQKLQNLAAAHEKSRGMLPMINIDGPYGLPFRFQQHTSILLIGGGIGITPLHSILRTIVLLASSSEGMGQNNHLLFVRLVWSVREKALCSLFKDTFERCILQPDDKGTQTRVRFEIELFSSSADAAGVEEDGLPVKLTRGRIDFAGEVTRLKSNGGNSPIIHCCGPEEMVQEARSHAINCNVAYSHETFLL